ncbi:MAG TPA: glucose-6-phosphate dehydrogenase [Actinomycetota bacterium]|nr:glucose-6-phosphate dehydrogenase [Actinomycetota bacterium]
MAPAADAVADALVVFGVTGDLARKMTLPALYRLARRKELYCRIIGVGRREWTDEELRERTRTAIGEADVDVDEVAMEDLLARLTYVAGDATDPATLERLADELSSAKTIVHYLALPPSMFADTVRRLADADLVSRSRVVVEKPFGTDLASAIELDRELHEVLEEDQLFRIDHFLGKEPVQDILYLRFANEIFEPVWNRHHIESVQINMFEDFGVDDRGSFYDGVGALRDVVQNHLLQVLALVAMEPPPSGQGAVADHRTDVFRAMPAADPRSYVRGQYRGYRDVPGVDDGSATETFAALELRVHNWRWYGVPFLVRAGKSLATTATDITVRFATPPPLWWQGDSLTEVPQHNHLTIRIGKGAGASIGVLVKKPGEPTTERVHLDLSFERQLGELPAPYERLLFDAMRGRHDLFPRQDAVEETWRIVQPLLDAAPEPLSYEPGSDGPAGANRLAEGHGGWRRPVPHRPHTEHP